MLRHAREAQGAKFAIEDEDEEGGSGGRSPSPTQRDGASAGKRLKH
jgi:hypothetical protein